MSGFRSAYKQAEEEDEDRRRQVERDKLEKEKRGILAKLNEVGKKLTKLLLYPKDEVSVVLSSPTSIILSSLTDQVSYEVFIHLPSSEYYLFSTSTPGEYNLRDGKHAR